MSVFLAFCSSLLYGSADFSGAYATRKNSVFSVLVFSQTAGAALAICGAIITGSGYPLRADLCWGFLAGAGGSMGLILLYKGLSLYPASIVSPLSALTGALIPVLWGLVSGERPSGPALAGSLLCLPAILLISVEKKQTLSREILRSSFLYGIFSGCGFAFFFIAIAQTRAVSGLWPLVSARFASLCIVVLLLAFQKKQLSVTKEDRLPAFLSGIMDMGANICFLLASRGEYLILVTLVTSLYPVPTLLLSRIFLGQKISFPRGLGIGLGIAGIALIGMK